MNFKSLLKLSLAHHPLCWQYRTHVIRLKDWSFCLGCSGFYSGLLIGLLIIFLGFLNFVSWFELMIMGLLLYLPTLFRLVRFPFFSTPHKSLRFLFRFLLGMGTMVGLLSIWTAPAFYIQVFLIIFGLGMYAALGVQRFLTKDRWPECNTCTFSPNSHCPGFSPFFYPLKK